jgi:hypothetical protein
MLTKFEGENKMNPRIKQAVLEIVENQLAENDPEITRQTLDRLMKLSYSREEAVEKIATVVVAEIFEVLQQERTFDIKSFTKALKALS